MITNNPTSRKSIRQKRNPVTRKEDFLMDNRLVTDKVNDT
jgi:hypothetical protein